MGRVAATFSVILKDFGDATFASPQRSNGSRLSHELMMASQATVIHEDFADELAGGPVSAYRRDAVESDRQFYMRRVTAERQAAARAITEEARQRRMMLVAMYMQKLQAIPA